MYPIIKTVHSYWSIFVLIMIIVVILNSIRGKVLGKDFEVNDLRLSLFGLIFRSAAEELASHTRTLKSG